MDKIEDLLLKTSRTFALSIPLLDAPLRQQIALAYLLFRIADTFEDAETWAPEKRIEALERFEKMLQEQADDQAWKEATKAWSSQQPSEHEGYIELIEEIPFVMQTFFTQVSPEAQQVISHHTIRTTQGMVRFLTQMDHEGSLRLDTLQELRDYCYVVAGIVGDLLSELFLLEETSLKALDAEEKAGWLKQGVAFGEGLQLTRFPHVFQFFQAFQATADRAEVRQRATQPAFRHVGHAAEFGGFLDRISGLTFGSHKQNQAALG